MCIGGPIILIRYDYGVKWIIRTVFAWADDVEADVVKKINNTSKHILRELSDDRP